MKAPLARTLTLFALALCSLVACAASLQTPENTTLLTGAATVTAGGFPGSTNLAGSNFMISAVAPATLRAGRASLISARQWVSRFTNNAASLQSGTYATALRPDGSIIVAGYSIGGTNGYNFLTLCYAADGTPLWTSFYDGPSHGDDTAASVAVGTNGTVWVTGASMRYATNSLLTDVALVCYASNGVPQWTNRCTSHATDGDSPVSLLVDGSGNAYLNLLSSSDSGTSIGYTIIKFDPLGNPLWTNAFPADAPDSGQAPHDAEAMALDPAGDLFVAGMTGSQHEHTGSAVVKFAGDGTRLWTNYQASPPYQSIKFLTVFRTLVIDPQGDVIATAEGVNTNFELQYIMMKFSGDAGSPVWTNIMAGPGYSGGGVPQTLPAPAGDLLFVGGAAGTSLPGLFQITKLDRNGLPLWTNPTAGFGSNASPLYAATVDSAGDLYLAGDLPDPGNNSTDFAIIKYSSSGVPVWTNLYDGPAKLADYAYTLAVNGRGQVFISGQSTGLGGAFESVTVAYADELSYTPPKNFVGLDTVNCTLTDVFGSSAAGSVPVLVTSTNFQVVPIGMESSPAGFQVDVEGVPSTNVVIIEASSDLVHWQPVFTNAPVQGLVQFLDHSTPGLARRFYRAEQQ